MRKETGRRGISSPPKEAKPPRDALEIPSRALRFLINRGFEERESGHRSGTTKEWLAEEILLSAETAEVLRALSRSAHSFERQAFKRHGPTGLGVAAAHSALSSVLESASTSEALAIENLEVKERLIVDALRASGINAWLNIVRLHHSPTYRHSLLVTGVAVAFAQSIEIRVEDQQLIARAALLHDVGKRFIPLNILDKPTKLTAAEMNKIREHPVRGHKLLLEQGGFSEQILDCVLHHHELLDGSGYPDGLKAAQIGDLVRIITIADIFSALIEQRAYKKPLPAEKAFEIMRQMDGKLDGDLMRVFGHSIGRAR